MRVGAKAQGGGDVLVPTGISGFRDPAAFVTGFRQEVRARCRLRMKRDSLLITCSTPSSAITRMG